MILNTFMSETRKGAIGEVLLFGYLILFCSRHVQSKSRGCTRRDGPEIDDGRIVREDEMNEYKARRGAQKVRKSRERPSSTSTTNLQ